MAPEGPPAPKSCKRCGRPYPEHYRPCRWCGDDEVHHVDGQVDGEIQSRARFASCKVDAGLPLNSLDAAALNVWGDRPLGKVTP